MKLPRWIKPVYLTQVLTGFAGIGAILITEHITRWHILVVGIIGASLMGSLIVTARAESDSQRNKNHIETLLRGMELPYFIIEAVSKVIVSSAEANGWTFTTQENFQQETVYEFRSTGNEAGRLVVPEQEFKDLWVLDNRARLKAIEERLFGVDSPSEKHLTTVVKEAIAEQIAGRCRITKETAPDSSEIFRVTTEASGSADVRFSLARLRELSAMPPLPRYHAAAEQVKQALEGLRV